VGRSIREMLELYLNFIGLILASPPWRGRQLAMMVENSSLIIALSIIVECKIWWSLGFDQPDGHDRRTLEEVLRELVR
jgi:hypothetical protein